MLIFPQYFRTFKMLTGNSSNVNLKTFFIADDVFAQWTTKRPITLEEGSRQQSPCSGCSTPCPPSQVCLLEFKFLRV